MAIMPLVSSPRRRGDLGAVSEMVVCIDLLRRGYGVFRAVSPQCACDLVAMDGDRCLRIEVRTGHVHPPTGTCGVSVRTSDQFDVFAVVVGDVVGYLPALDPGDEFPFTITPSARRRIMDLAGRPNA